MLFFIINLYLFFEKIVIGERGAYSKRSWIEFFGLRISFLYGE